MTFSKRARRVDLKISAYATAGDEIHFSEDTHQRVDLHTLAGVTDTKLHGFSSRRGDEFPIDASIRVKRGN